MVNVIQIAMGADQNYFCGLLVTAVSMARNCSKDAVVSYNMLDGGINAESKAYLEKKCREVHKSCSFNWISINTQRFDQYPKFLDKGMMTYARLLLPDLLPTCDHVIYTDVDILWLADVAELWAKRDDDIILQSVTDGVPEAVVKEGAWFREHGYKFDAERYFCAGMCFINLAKFRKEDMVRKLLEFIEQHPTINAHDQTALNVLMSDRDDVIMLPTKWQQRTVPLFIDEITERSAIHYAADAPWRNINYIHLLTDFHLLWFRIEAQIRGLTTWQVMRGYYSAWKLISSRFFFVLGSSSRFGYYLLKLSMSVLAPSKNFDCLIPFLRLVEFPRAWNRF